MTWETAAQRDGTTTFYVFRGQFGEAGTEVAWGTAYVATSSGRIDGIMQAPGVIACGLPQTWAAPPERVTTEIVLNNTDRSLDTYMVGGTSAANEYSLESFYDLRGRIYLGLIDTDGTIYEEPVTPTLTVAGQVVSKGGQIVLPLASLDSQTFGPTSKLVTVEMLRDGTHDVTEGEAYSLRGDANGSFDASAFADRLNRITESLDATVPYAFGRALIPLTHVYSGSSAGLSFVAFVAIDEPVITDAASWDYFRGTSEGSIKNSGIRRRMELWKGRTTVTFDDSSTLQVWVVGLDFQIATETHLEKPSYLLPPSTNPVGMSSGVHPSPAKVLQHMIGNLCDGGSAVIDSASFSRAAKALNIGGLCGGIVRSNAALAELATHICSLGFALIVEPDDKVHCVAVGGWTAADKTAAEGTLPHIRLDSEAEGTWEEWLPFGADERGSPATRVTMEWSDDQREFWPKDVLIERAPGLVEVDRSETVEARLSGAWVYPPAADMALANAVSRRVFVARRFSFVTRPWVATHDKGSLFRISHPFGMDGSGDGYEHRLARLERTELIPAENACRVVFEDCGPLELLRPGKLDNRANWVHTEATGGTVLSMTAASTTVTAGAATFTSDMVGCSLWTPLLSASDRARKIAEVVSSTEVTVDRAYDATSSTGTWKVMLNRATEGWSYRPDYITEADESTGTHSDTEAAFRMLG